MQAGGIEPADVLLVSEKQNACDGALESGDLLDGLLGKSEMRGCEDEGGGGTYLAHGCADGSVDVRVRMLEVVVVVRCLGTILGLAIPRTALVLARTSTLLRVRVFRRHI